MRRKSQGSFPTGLEMDLNACQSSPRPGLYQQSSNPRKVSRLWDGWTERGWSWRSFLPLPEEWKNSTEVSSCCKSTTGRVSTDWSRFPSSGAANSIGFHCSSSLWHTQHLWLPAQALKPNPHVPGTANKTPKSVFGGKITGVPQHPRTSWQAEENLFQSTESRNSSSHISDWFLVQGGSVPTGTSPTMAFISSDPHSHPHNGNKNKNPPLITRPVQYYEWTLMHKRTTFEKN